MDGDMDMDVPPLEDLSSVLQKVLRHKDVTADNHFFDSKPNTASSVATVSDSCNQTSPPVSGLIDFGTCWIVCI